MNMHWRDPEELADATGDYGAIGASGPSDGGPEDRPSGLVLWIVGGLVLWIVTAILFLESLPCAPSSS